MRTLAMEARGRARRAPLGRLAAERRHLGLLAASSLAIGLGYVWLADASVFEGSGLPRPGIAAWAWIFGASGCLRVLASGSVGRWLGVPTLRLVCGVVGLVSWSQLSWLVLQAIAATAGVAAGCAGVYAVVALRELQTIYRAAHDARLDHA